MNVPRFLALLSLTLVPTFATVGLDRSLLPAAHAAAPASVPTVDALLAGVDRNLTFDTRTVTLHMTVTKNGRTKTYAMKSYGRGADEAAVEYLEPARDKGTKMLKRANELWMYLPSIEKVQKISGHMLRQGMMGSDMSYEDLMQASAWRSLYKGTVVGPDTVDGRTCWKVELTATQPDVSYPRRVTWVDQATNIPLRQELYAVSGMLLKVWTMSDVVDVGGRKFPTRMVVEDQLQKGSRTELRFSDLAFAVPVAEETFSQRWLER
jgi:outer membrane lipoprotein-sorting protein